MKIQISARHVQLTKGLKDHSELRVKKLEHYFDHIAWAQVILTVEKKAKHKAEIIIHAAKQTFSASAISTDMYASIDLASTKIEKQLKKLKDKLKDKHIHREKPEEFITETVIPDQDVRISVVKPVEVKPMKAEEAAREMEILGYNFWMFVDKETKQTKVIFKRLDGSYGILEPTKKKR
ncbi:MAG: ribosome-associated translation inhibitor RaiA [Elusimicrobiaceae bacterium]|jgi:putative sigma-54 modulation protein|nr:ribosome-associated translation inhibitor RaiA [Elusimicrobiaceae bacterium]MBT3955158.1 ribosome-associated translation inhibitor RaiA [Elusimicrobiaceae bacterium]MBT4008689.1 ribosome-associated translation inhibitor RaiA [Elusimicrobiaceae bacterium]MBT4402487.1 ribosome-associated translation inhibitor RaiA [Elusimicrobiaceae bacterium]MBT4440149.1 ribosome-associated translation inhibitor RaiA [Elusimicrobiaceae bacterium]